jgi:hypothetical protein
LGFPAPISQQPGEFSSGNSTERKRNNSKRNRGGDTGIRGILCWRNTPKVSHSVSHS